MYEDGQSEIGYRVPNNSRLLLGTWEKLSAAFTLREGPQAIAFGNAGGVLGKNHTSRRRVEMERKLSLISARVH
ncbi:hypothetical protein SKAU_G00055120 [Synaphobranchus kaupii]|uniref:Uncharacterized protein n=1 Tax=Synaphobranchus kaupii TaxID=118154 RepID=A0A9Q1G3S8_SYNKA|nr:hypothetical protein SKAU_G00055120 [Synaphobranchus kaupii]